MANFCGFLPCCSPLAGVSFTVGKGKNTQGPIQISYGFCLVKGTANHPMEDYHVAEFVVKRGHELGVFAVFDGHSGNSVPAYLQKHLFNNILKEEEFWTDPNAAITKAYDKTDKAILSNSPELGRGGSTAVTVIIVNGTKLWIANLGDSRAVLAKNGKATQLSVDHDPHTERESIEQNGGFVSYLPGDVPRVNGQLAVARAFGDKSLKSHLRSNPDIQSVNTSVDTEFLILASDGIWKVINNQEAVDLIRKIKDPQAAAKRLAVEAIKRKSKDDISCVIIRFKR